MLQRYGICRQKPANEIRQMVSAAFQDDLDFSREKPVKLDKACEIYDVCRRTMDKWRALGLRVRPMGPKLLYTTLEEMDRFSRKLAGMQMATASTDVGEPSNEAIDAERRVRERWSI